VEVAQLAIEVFDEFIAPLYSAEGVAEFHRYSDPKAFDERNRADHLTLVAEYDSRIVGMLQLRTFSHISMLFVSAESQRNGVGRGLLNKAIELCRRHSPQVRVLTVKFSPNAVNAYARLVSR
jgi:GNAT superfamily N-acetyltransferase